MKVWEAILLPDNGGQFSVGLFATKEKAEAGAKQACRERWQTEDKYFWYVEQREIK